MGGKAYLSVLGIVPVGFNFETPNIIYFNQDQIDRIK